jgi:predicted RNA-binding Zn ribbon-like protein
MEVAAHSFRPADLVGGHLALDFANTVNGRDTAPADWLDGYSRLVSWAALTHAFPASFLSRLGVRARREPTLAARALSRARRLREALFSVFDSLAGGRPPPPEALALVERQWKEAIRVSRLPSGRGGGEPALDLRRAGLDAIRLEVALHGARLLGELPEGRLRLCSGSGCAWLFLDTSRGGRRRWCDMATCGNVAKARRYNGRRRAG